MRWNVYQTEWKKWFAWYPVYIGEQGFWLEYVERRQIKNRSGWGHYWLYRKLEKENERV